MGGGGGWGLGGGFVGVVNFTNPMKARLQI